MLLNVYYNRLILSLAADSLLNSGHLNLHEPEREVSERDEGRFFMRTFDLDIPALIYIRRCYRDEWIISVALWPTLDAEAHMRASNPCAKAGAAFFSGWLNRWMKKGEGFGIETFHDAVAYISSPHRARLAEIQSPTRGRAGILTLVSAHPDERKTFVVAKARRAASARKSLRTLHNVPTVQPT